jgi:GGDEF domain-containing protein
MKRRSDWFFFGLVILVIVGFVCLAGYSILDSRAKALALADDRFDSLRDLVASAANMGGSFASKTFREQVALRYRSDSSLLGVILRDGLAATDYAIPAESAFMATEISGAGRRKDVFTGFADFTVTVKKTSVILKDGTERWLEAAYVVLPAKAVSDPLRLCLWGAIIVFFLSAVSLIILYSRPETDERATDPFPAADPVSYAPPSIRAAYNDDEFTVPDIADDIGPEPSTLHDAPLREFPAGNPEPLEGNGSSLARFSLPPLDEIAESADPRPIDAPRGLYSPRSGLGWEAYLEERLEAEIARSSSAGKDCAVLLIALESLDSESAQSDQDGWDAADHAITARSIESFFGFKDLAFERGEDGFAVALPGAGLDDALKSAEDFLDSVGKGPWANRAAGGMASKGCPSLRAGASSLSGRNVKAADLLGEAAIALEKARAGGRSRVVGFRADPDRYRDYIAGKL